MNPQSPYTVLLIGKKPPAELVELLKNYPAVGEVFRATHGGEVERIVRDNQIAFIVISVRDWSVHLFTSLVKMSVLPCLVVFQDDNDWLQLNGLTEGVLVLRRPLYMMQLREICMARRRGMYSDYDCIWIEAGGNWKRLACNDIVLVQRLPNYQLLICTNENDYIIDGSLPLFMDMLPQDKFMRISNTLTIPVKKKTRITEKGYPFRGGWFPLPKNKTK